jgi:hypothetical protein
MLTQNNLLSFAAGAAVQYHEIFAPTGTLTKETQERAVCNFGSLLSNLMFLQLSYLPLAHIMQRVGEVYSLYNGTKIGYFSGVIATDLLPDLQVYHFKRYLF